MSTGHELGSEGLEQGGDGGLPQEQDVPLPGSLGVRMRSVIVVPAQPSNRLAPGQGGVEDSAGLGLPATPSHVSHQSLLKESEQSALRAESEVLHKLGNLICPGCKETAITFRGIKSKTLVESCEACETFLCMGCLMKGVG